MEVITFGETMVMFNPDSTGPLRYIHNFTKGIAGAESNLAVGLSRMGHNVGWFSHLGNDEFGRYIKSVIQGEDVDVSRVRFDDVNRTGLLFKERFGHVDPNVYYYRHDSAASNMTPEGLDEDYIKQAKVLHVTGITMALSQSARETVFRAMAIARENGVLVSFDPNIRRKLWSLEEAKKVLLEAAGQCDIIFPGIDEAKVMLGLEEPEAICESFIEMGCKIVALKLGKKGCYVANAQGGTYIEGYKVEKVEDTVGAGDGFAAGFLSGILQECPIETCGQYANAVGAMATLVSGDMEGLPTHDQLKAFMNKEERVDR